MMCNGTEDQFRDCQYSTAISAECSNGDHVAGVRCVEGMFEEKLCVCLCGHQFYDQSFSTAARPCYPGSTLQFNTTYSNVLVNGDYLSIVEGTFEQCIGGFYGPVCDIGWDERDATAFCQGFQGTDYGKLLKHRQ